MSITDERLDRMLADQEQFASWTDDADDKRDALEIAAALHELQQRRRNELQLIADINAMGSDDD